MQATLCSYCKPDRLSCRAVAVAGCRLCLSHKRLDQRARRQQRYQQAPAIRLGPLADHGSVQRAISRVARAIASGSLPLERCAAHLQRLQLVSGSLAGSMDLSTCGPHPILGIELFPFALTPLRPYNQPNPRRENPPAAPNQKDKDDHQSDPGSPDL